MADIQDGIVILMQRKHEEFLIPICLQSAFTRKSMHVDSIVMGCDGGGDGDDLGDGGDDGGDGDGEQLCTIATTFPPPAPWFPPEFSFSAIFPDEVIFHTY